MSIVPLGITAALKMIPADVMVDCRKSQGVMAEGKPVHWVAASIIIAIWLMVAAVLAVWVFRVLEKC